MASSSSHVQQQASSSPASVDSVPPAASSPGGGIAAVAAATAAAASASSTSASASASTSPPPPLPLSIAPPSTGNNDVLRDQEEHQRCCQDESEASVTDQHSPLRPPEVSRASEGPRHPARTMQCGPIKLSVQTVSDLTLAAWILKDLSWCLLCAPLAAFATIEAIFAAVVCLLLEWQRATWGVRVHGTAELLWLLGNSCWILAEFLWDKKEVIPGPWYHGPLAGASAESYDAWSPVILFLWAVGIAALIGYYAQEVSRCGNRQTAGRQVVVGDASEEGPNDGSAEFCDYGVGNVNLGSFSVAFDLYSRVYIGPWIVKDMFWFLEFPYCTQLCGVIVLISILDCWRRSKSMFFVAEGLWVLGNMMWAMNELQLSDSFVGLWCAVGLLTAALVVALSNLGCHDRGQASEKLPVAKAEALAALPKYCATNSDRVQEGRPTSSVGL